ncbi:SOS response-associated peptidase family protein [Brevibacterium sandarakinum]|uniref:SOS response-associated peptidase family protein n=1 Tax=Brevibacterium sandarakinum TaxID=629680 RepID=UPI002652763D|nr:SOS response-associated peptidase family protein [Brevibacterium sandarakinum]MDN5658705.1 SOS response-associated peptidase [Brevibacterium sandarakinum]
MLATSDIFRGPFSSGRSAVPMTGYYEWVETDGGGKVPCFMRHPAGELLYAAGLTAARKGDDGEDSGVTFMVVTRKTRRRSGALCACIGLRLSPLLAEAYGRA